MLNVYHRKGPELGFVFQLFSKDQWVNDFHVFESQAAARVYLMQSKTDFLLNNIETFVDDARKGFTPQTKNIQKEAAERLSAAVKMGKQIPP